MGRKSRAKASRRAQLRQSPTTSVFAPAPPGAWPAPPEASWPSLPTDGWPVVPSAASPQEPTVDPGRRLRSLCKQQRELLHEIEQEIHVLLEHGHSWSIVGAALGISRQGARQRYRRLIDRPG